MPTAILCIAVVWAASLAIVVVVAVSMDGVSCLASAASTLREDGGDHVATRRMTSRTVTHAEAEEASRRLINSHFLNPDGARVSIPANPDRDDDLVLTSYIAQRKVACYEAAQRARDAIERLERIAQQVENSDIPGIRHDLYRILDHVTGKDHSGCSGQPPSKWRPGCTAIQIEERTTNADGEVRIRTGGALPAVGSFHG